jgi:hypothetical protein
MNAHNDAKRLFDQNLDARLVLAAARLRFAALVDRLVARWLQRCAVNAEAAQSLFRARSHADTSVRDAREACRSSCALG